MVECTFKDEPSGPYNIEPVRTSSDNENSQAPKANKRKSKPCRNAAKTTDQPRRPNVNLFDAEYDLNDFSMDRWNSLLERTKEIRSLAYNSPAMLAHLSSAEILDQLDGVIEFMSSLDSPAMDDFKFVDSKMEKIHEAVGQAIDKFLMEQREKKNMFTRRLYTVTKVIALCSVIFGLLSFASEWYPGLTGVLKALSL